tara:strand:+ start:837 stop:998 length:162 start_codon:yes stop_codon:yes gene_type:complete
MTEDIVLEEVPVHNIKMEEALNKTLEFNNSYINYLKTKLKEAKKIKEEIVNGG